MKRLIVLALIGYFAWTGYTKYQARHDARAEAFEESPAADLRPLSAMAKSDDSVRFKCDGRTYCSQMTSCAEATYFLGNCPGTKMDGNNDGVPCEKQWCR